MNILWIKPDQTLAITNISSSVDPRLYAAQLQRTDGVPSTWVLAATSVVWPTNPMFQECYRWDGSAIVVDNNLYQAALTGYCEKAIQKVLDDKAREHGYTDIKSACAYASSIPVVLSSDPCFSICEKFRLEGNALQSWMSLTWAKAYAYLGTVQTGTNEAPSIDQAVGMIPSFVWPT